jgi:hypothetical protein
MITVATERSADRRWQTATVGSLALWGALHVVGGVLLVVDASHDGGRAALESLGSAAAAAEMGGEPGAVTQAVLGFHGFNLAVAGLAVLALAVTIVRTSWPRGVTTALAVETVLDLGLIVFLLGPGHMALSDGLAGPALLVVGGASALVAGWRPRQW